MRRNLLTICSAMLLFASCSSPKYSYYFDHYDYNSGKKKIVATEVAQQTEEAPLTVNPEMLTASAGEHTIVLEEQPLKKEDVAVDKKTILEKYTSMSKAERKEFRKELKSEIKKYTKAKKEVESEKSTEALDRDAKFAIIFGGIGIIFLLFPGDVFLVLAAVSLIIGFVFFVKWISRQ